MQMETVPPAACVPRGEKRREMCERPIGMVRVARFLVVWLLAVCAGCAMGQGGAAGYGQNAPAGGRSFGGGMGGGGFEGSPEKPAPKPDDDETPNLWKSKTAILTPGDRVEIKFVLKKGETLLASATSDAFDPALSVSDEKGKELVKNDDRVEGDQSPFLIFRAAGAGTYVLKVLSYRSVSGGKFAAKWRTFVAFDAGSGSQTHTLDANLNEPGRTVFRIAGKKNRIYDLRSIIGISQGAETWGGNITRIIGPTGVPLSDYTALPTPDRTPVFLALADGDYYAEYATNPAASQIRTDYRELSAGAVKATDSQSLSFESGELKVLEFPVKPNLIVRTTLAGSIEQSFSAPDAENEQESFPIAPDQSYATNRAYTYFRVNLDSDADVVRIFHGDGVARLVLRCPGDGRKITVKNAESLPDWTQGDTKGSIEIGESRLFLVKSSKSELMRVAAGASHFQPRLDIFRLNGELANSLCDRRTHKAGDDLYFPVQDTFVIRMSCDGQGGSGDYEMSRASLQPSAYRLGGVETLKLDGSNFGLYSANLEKGKRYLLTIDYDPANPTRVDLLDDEGQFLNSQSIEFEHAQQHYFVPTRSGRHRLWLRGAPGTRKFKLELHIAPSVGG